jgi:hypothetical protein
MAKLRDIRMEELPPHERAVKSGLTFLFVPIIIILGVGLGMWVGLKCNGVLPCAVTGIIISQVLMLVGIREIVLFGHRKET